MKITRTSIMTNITRTKDLPIAPYQWEAYQAGAFIQRAMPDLTADEREFILSGMTAEEWAEVTGNPASEAEEDDGQALASAGHGTDEDYGAGDAGDWR